MWGIWFILTFAVSFGVVGLLIALVVGASPLLAVLLVIVALAVLAAIFAWRRSVAHVEDDEPEAGGAPAPNPRSGGAPVSGEGS